MTLASDAPLTDADRAGIERLYLDYVAIVDGGDLERWPELFTADCSYRITSRENVRRGPPAGPHALRQPRHAARPRERDPARPPST